MTSAGEQVTPERVVREIQGRFNPIRGLTPDLLSRRLEMFRVGFIRDVALTWDAMEERDINLKNVASKRKKAASRCDWEILTTDESDEAKQQKEALEFFYNNLRATSVMEQNQRGGISLLIRQMLDALGKRFAVHEIVWKPQSSVGVIDIQRGTADAGSGETPLYLDSLLTAEFRFCPLWFFENRTGRLRFIQTPFGVDGIDMREGDWLVTVGDGLMEACSVAYMFKQMSLKDWVAFSEKFGLPGVLGKTDATKDSPEWQAMLDAVKSLVNDWSAVCNRSAEIELLEPKNGASNLPFPPLVEYMDRKIAAIWRGADLSTISQGKEGVGASLQGDEGDLLLEDDCQLVSETLNEQVDRFAIRFLFGPQARVLAYVKVLPPNKQNVDLDLKVDDFLVRNGAPLSVRGTMERYGRPLPEAGDDLLRLPSPQPSPPGEGAGQVALPNESRKEVESAQAKLKARGEKALALALANDLKPIRDRLDRILAIENEDLLRSKLSSFLAELPSLARSIGADPESAKVIEQVISAGLVNGFAETRKEATK